MSCLPRPCPCSSRRRVFGHYAPVEADVFFLPRACSLLFLLFTESSFLVRATLVATCVAYTQLINFDVVGCLYCHPEKEEEEEDEEKKKNCEDRG